MPREQSSRRQPAETHGTIIQSTLGQSQSAAELQRAAATPELLHCTELLREEQQQ